MALSVLVTGGAGFIGCALAERLLTAGHDVVVLDSLHAQVHASSGRPARLPAGARLVPGDVTSEASWEAVLELVRPDVVVHLAAETGTGQSASAATPHAHVNVVGTARMLDALRHWDAVPHHLVLASSRAVYGEGAWVDDSGLVFHPGPRRHHDLASGHWGHRSPSGVPASPLPSRAGVTLPRPASVYGATKLAQEHMCEAWAAATGTALSVLRLQNVYGPGQSLANPYTGVVALFARLALCGQALDVYEDGEIVRDFVHVDDAVDALAAAVTSPPATSRTVDVGSGNPTTIRAVAELVAELAGAPVPVVSGRFRDGDVRAASCVIDDSRAELGWAPSRPLAEGLRELLAWVTEESGSPLPTRHA